MGKRKGRRTPYYFDYNLLFLIIFIMAFGLIMLYSATAFSASMQASDPSYYLKKQLIFSIGGLMVMAFFIFSGNRWIRKLSVLIYAGSIGSVLLLLTPLGDSSHGATRWIRIGSIGIQPAELVKIAIIILMADLICRIGRGIATRQGIGLVIGISTVSAGLVYVISQNLSSAIIIFAIGFIMFFVAHPRYKGFVLLGILGIGLVLLLVFVISPILVKSGGSFRIDRIEAWKNPEQYADTTGYQTLQALYAIGSGGVFGKGLGKSAQKLIIPEAQNDMIFSIICEELGIFGAVAVLLLFLLILYRMVLIAKNAKDRFSALLVVGVTAHIAIQVLFNIAVVTNLFPTTGITLPFISYGGSATICLLAEVGMVLGVSRSIKLE